MLSAIVIEKTFLLIIPALLHLIFTNKVITLNS